MKKKYTSYSIWEAMYPDARRDDLKHWYLELDHLTADDIHGLAIAWKFKKERIEKLINHTSKKFTYIKKKGTEIIKHFHNAPPEYWHYNDPRQPQSIRMQAIIDKAKEKQNALMESDLV